MARLESAGLLERLKQHVDIHPGRTAVIWRNERVTYIDLWQRSTHLARNLEELVVFEPILNKRVLIRLENEVSLACAYFACLRAGMSPILTDPEASEPQHFSIATATSAQFLIDQSSYDRILRRVPKRAVGRLAALPENGAPQVIFSTAGTAGSPKLIEHSLDGLTSIIRPTTLSRSLLK